MTRTRWCLVIAIGGLGALMFGGLLFYYGDVSRDEYLWKGPVGTVIIVTVCVAVLVALQHRALMSWVRGVGYVATAALGSVLAFAASASYYELGCNDPAGSACMGLPILGAMLWAIGAAAGVIAMATVAEFLRHRWSSSADGIGDGAHVVSGRTAQELRHAA